jgi:deoxycytidine triphosphate deaminase
MILSADAIKDAINKDDLSIRPFNGENLKPASYTFTLSSKILIPKKVSCIKIGESEREEIVMSPDGFILNPGEFVLGYTEEHISLKNKYGCFLSTRGSCAQAGLSVLLGSDFAEPDTDNCIILEIHNASNCPIKLETGMKIVKGIFVEI